jgi:ubiquinone/menaquinone biosynthesis C-methylase UbiE
VKESSLSNADELPDYAPMLSAYHDAHATELREMVASLPIHEGSRVLEIACGDGVYSRWIAERVGGSGEVVGVDVLPAYLEVARRGAMREASRHRIRFVAADIARLPFPDDTFDLVWCAQSLYSLPDPVDALRRMTRVVRAGGEVAVLENDSFHHVLLPWPVEVEVAIRRAELLGFVEESDRPRKYYVGRQLCQVYRASGLRECRRRTWATDRQAPLERRERAYLEEYLGDLRERAEPHLEPTMRAKFERLVNPDSEDYLLDRPDLSVTYVDHVVRGVKPGAWTPS